MSRSLLIRCAFLLALTLGLVLGGCGGSDPAVETDATTAEKKPVAEKIVVTSLDLEDLFTRRFEEA